MTTIYSVNYDNYAPFGAYARQQTIRHPSDILTHDAIVLLHGGSDISPTYYNETPIKENQANTIPSERDKMESAIIERCIQMKIPMFGICRGAQFLCISAGGKLWQDVSGHGGGTHPIRTREGLSFEANSCHHQMMRLENTDHELIAWTNGLSRHYKSEAGTVVELDVPEPEVVWFPKIKGFAVQGHPEWMSMYSPWVQWLRSEFFKRI